MSSCPRCISLLFDELAEAYRCGFEPDPDGGDRLIGRDPNAMTLDELRALGHEPKTDEELWAMVARTPDMRPTRA